jgi:hypothetical protein
VGVTVTFWILDAKGGVKGKKWCWFKGELLREVMRMQVLRKNWSLISSHALHCIVLSLLHIYLYLWTYECVFIFEQWFVFIIVLLNLRFVIILDYICLLIYGLYNYCWFISSWMMRILSLKNAIQWIYENLLPHRIHIGKVITSHLSNYCA